MGGADLSVIDSYGRTCAEWLEILLPKFKRELALEPDRESSIFAGAGLQHSVVKISSSLLNTRDDTVYLGFSTRSLPLIPRYG